MSNSPGAIGIFDSGYGGLTILDAIRRELPQYDYIYLGDNARAPYGPRSFDIVYQFTREAVQFLFNAGCHLVILGCNTASAKALRTIQQNDLPLWDETRRVLGVIRPTAEDIGSLTKTRHVGILATEGTILSESYKIEIEKLHPDIKVTGEACHLWVPIVEYNETDTVGADFFVKKHIDNIMEKDPEIDTLLLGCTHYPLLRKNIDRFVPKGVTIMEQGGYVARSLHSYLLRHPEMDKRCTRGGTTRYLTTENTKKFDAHAYTFLNEQIHSEHVGQLSL